MPLLTGNPFASLTLIAGPAVLTNASSVLALGSFAASALVSLIGATIASSTHHLVFRLTLAIGAVTGSIGVGSIAFGCVLLVGETRLAVKNVQEEATLVRERFSEYLTASEKAGEPG